MKMTTFVYDRYSVYRRTRFILSVMLDDHRYKGNWNTLINMPLFCTYNGERRQVVAVEPTPELVDGQEDYVLVLCNGDKVMIDSVVWDELEDAKYD